MGKSTLTEYAPYEEGSWDEWDRTLLSHIHRTSRESKGAFLPSPYEIEERKELLRWLQQCGFSNRFICCVMQHEHPGINLVKKLVDKHGSEEAARRLEPFLPPTEYDHLRPV